MIESYDTDLLFFSLDKDDKVIIDFYFKIIECFFKQKNKTLTLKRNDIFSEIKLVNNSKTINFMLNKLNELNFPIIRFDNLKREGFYLIVDLSDEFVKYILKNKKKFIKLDFNQIYNENSLLNKYVNYKIQLDSYCELEYQKLISLLSCNPINNNIINSVRLMRFNLKNKYKYKKETDKFTKTIKFNIKRSDLYVK